MKKQDCLFCKLVYGEFESATIFENSEFRVVLDKFPATRGHVLIIPKEHVENIFEMDSELAGRLFALAAHMAKVMRRALPLEGLNILQNNGAIAGQTVFHFHLHLIPRYADDTVKIHWEAMKPTDEELKSIAGQISKIL